MSSERRVNPPRKCKRGNTFPATGESDTPAALLNDVVLQNIFKYLGYKDLKSCRQVGNSLWLRNSKKAWWSRTKIVFKGPCPDKRLENYLEQTEITSNATNYHFESFHANCEEYCDRLGPSMKYLHIDFSFYNFKDGLRKLIYTQCPNLEELILSGGARRIAHKDHNAEPPGYQKPIFREQINLKSLIISACPLPVSWTELLSHFPNLQTLEASSGNDGIFKAIAIIRQHDSKMLKLTHIKITFYSDSDEEYEYEKSARSVLLDPDLSLESVHINAALWKPETVLDILDLHAKSLKELCIKGGHFQPLIKRPRRPLQLLEELSIDSCLFSVDIFKSTPIVKKFTLFCNDIIKNHSAHPGVNIKVNTCKELKIFASNQMEDSDSDFEILLNAFPNVERLEINYINNLRFSMICEHLKNLVSFNAISGNELDVVGLLGFNPSSKAKDRIRKANITNLKRLQSFSAVAYSFESEMIEMENGSVILKELELLPHLKKFELKNYKVSGANQFWKTFFGKYSGQ